MMKQIKIISGIASVLLTTASLLGLPTKSYAINVKDKCIDDKAPRFWTKQMSKAYARSYILTQYPSWNLSEYRALLKLWGKESGWSHTADNPRSTAYGIAQVLNTKKNTPAPLQIERGLEYIQHRYEKPSVAWAHWRKHNWY